MWEDACENLSFLHHLSQSPHSLAQNEHQVMFGVERVTMINEMIKSIKAITSYFFNLVNRTGRRKLLRFLQNCKASGWSCLKRIHNLVLLRRITCLAVPANLIHIPELRTELKTQQSEWSMEDSPPWTCQRNRVPFLFPRRR